MQLHTPPSPAKKREPSEEVKAVVTAAVREYENRLELVEKALREVKKRKPNTPDEQTLKFGRLQMLAGQRLGFSIAIDVLENIAYYDLEFYKKPHQ